MNTSGVYIINVDSQNTTGLITVFNPLNMKLSGVACTGILTRTRENFETTLENSFPDLNSATLSFIFRHPVSLLKILENSSKCPFSFFY